MKEGDIEFSVLFADNDKIRQVYEVQDGLKSSRRKFVQCFPACTQEHSCERFCGTPVSVVLTTNLKTSEAERCFHFDDVVFVAELRPIDANYTLQTSLSRPQLSKQIKQSGCLYTGSLVASTRGKQHNGDNSVQNGYYEFVLNAQNLPESRRKDSVSLETFYTFSVTVLVPLNKEETRPKVRTEKEKESILHPVAYFDSAPFFLKSSSGDKNTQIADQHQLPNSELQEAQSLINLYNTMQTERMALERRDLHVKLTSYADSKKSVPKVPVPAATPAVGATAQVQNHQQHLNHLQQQQQRGEKRAPESSQLMPPSKQTRGCVSLELVTEDILEVLQESTALAQRPYQWQSHKGKSIRDPTAGMMRGLVQQSALEKALLCITKHNSILHGDISLADEEDGMLVEENGESSAVDDATATATSAAEGEEKAKDGEPSQDKEKARLMLHGSSAGTKTAFVKTPASTTGNAGPLQGPSTGSNNEGQCAKKAQETPTSSVPALGAPESDAKQPEFLSLEHLKKHLMSQYRDPHAGLRQRQCFSDVLQSLTKATWQVALRVRRAAERIAPPLPASPSTAFDLYLSVMRDSRKEHHNLTRAFLASDPPPLRALNWATRYLHSHGELTFRSSRISAQTVAAAAAANAAAAAAAAAVAASAAASAAAAAAAASTNATAQSQQPPLVALDPHNTSSSSSASQVFPDKSALESAFAQSLQAEGEAEAGTRGEDRKDEGLVLPSFGDSLAGEAGRDRLLPLPLPGAEVNTSVAFASASASAVSSSVEGETRKDAFMMYIKEEIDCDNEDSFSSELDAGPGHTLSSRSVSVPAPAPAPVKALSSNSSAPTAVTTSASPKAPLRDPAEILAEFKALLAADSSEENNSGSEDRNQVSVDEAAPALALVALVSDYVCGGGCEKLRQQEQRAAEVRKQLHAQVETTHASQCALLQEAFLWESSAVSLENVGRSAEYFASYRLTPLGPLIINQNNDNEPKKVRPAKVPISAEAAAAAAATHEALKREINAKKFGIRADPDGPPMKVLARMTDIEPVEQPNPVRIRTKRSISNNESEQTAPPRPKRIRIRSKEARQAAAAAVTGRTATTTVINTVDSSGSSGSSKPQSNGKKAKGKGKSKAVKTVLAETRPLHRLTSMLTMAVGGRQGGQDGIGREGEGEGEGEEEGSDGNSLRSGTEDSASDSDSASLMSLASQDDGLDLGEEENEREEEGGGEEVV